MKICEYEHCQKQFEEVRKRQKFCNLSCASRGNGSAKRIGNLRYWVGKKRPDTSERNRHFTAAQKAAIKEKRKGWTMPEYARLKISVANKGRVPSEETRKKIAFANSGPRNYLWIADRTKLVGRHDRNFHDPEYKQWRLKVYRRDSFKCRIANMDCKGRIEAHHILGWKDYPELRYEANNGITLCHAHHPRARAEEKRLSPYFQSLVSVSK